MGLKRLCQSCGVLLGVLLSLTAAVGVAGATPMTSKAPVNLTFWFWGDLDAPGANHWLSGAVKAFEAKNPSIKINVVPQATNTFIQTFTTAATARKGPDIAAQWATGPVLTQVWNNAITPISDLVPASEIKHWRNTSENVYKGKTWAMPLYLIGIPWVWNKKLFKEAGVTGPLKTWSSFVSACGKLRAKGIVPFGFGDGAYWTTQLMLQDLNSLQDIIDADTGKAKFTSPKYARFENAWAQAVSAKCFNDDITSITQDKGQAMFASGKAAMTIGTDGTVRQWAKTVGAQNIGVSKWPVYGKGKLATAYDATQSTSYFVTSWSTHKKEGAAFLTFLHTPAMLNAWYAATGVPPADDRFNLKLIRTPLDKALYKLNTTGPQIWLQNYFPPQVDLNGNVPAQQKVFGGGSGAQSAQYRQRADDLWRAQKPDELKNWQGYHPATPK